MSSYAFKHIVGYTYCRHWPPPSGPVVINHTGDIVISMKQKRNIMALFVAFVYITFILMGNNRTLAANAPSITTDRPIYPIWHIGGTVRVTSANVLVNYTYYIWLQKPGQKFFLPAGPLLRTSTGNASLELHILPTDPAGTYLLSLSEQNTVNTLSAVTHFGVYGTDAGEYERTKQVTIAGGGFSPNSTIDLRAGNDNNSLPGFPTSMQTNRNGEFSFSFRLKPSTKTGMLNVTASGTTFDKHEAVTTSSRISVTRTTFAIQASGGAPQKIERTSPAMMNYSLAYGDGSPVTTGQYVAFVMNGQKTAGSATLTLADSTTGLWTATWVPLPDQDVATYNFVLTSSNLTDAYGNIGQGKALTSSGVSVTVANLEVTLAAQRSVQRTQNVTFEVIARYHNGITVQNFTQVAGNIIESNGAEIPVHLSVRGTKIIGTEKLPLNASLGQWRANISFKDIYGNVGSTKSEFNLIPPILTFNVNSPNFTQRTTFLNITATVAYPDATRFTSGVNLEVSFGNRTWTPEFALNSTIGTWTGQLYVPQNATLGVYNITLTAHDKYGNRGNYRTKTEIISARFRIIPTATNSTVEVLSPVDLPVLVAYPNGTVLNNFFGHVNAIYTNSTRTLVNLPLAYNMTDGRWHMYFTPTEEHDLNFTISAADSFGNAGVAPDAYRLKVNPTAHNLSQRLILAGVVGALVPIGLLLWAIATISTRRRKHRP